MSTNSIGMHPTKRMNGVCSPATEIVGPFPEVMVYAGAMLAIPMIAPAKAPIFPF